MNWECSYEKHHQRKQYINVAENKKSFILYCDLISVIEKLPNETTGKLFKIILEYVNDKNPIVNNRLLQIAFEPIKLQLKRDLRRYEDFKIKQSENGKLGGRPKTQKNPKNPSLFSKSQKSLTVNDTVTDNVNGIDIYKEPENFFKIEECLKISLNDDRWVTANKTNENELLEFNKILEGRGVYERLPIEYKSHFHDWKKKGKKEINGYSTIKQIGKDTEFDKA